MSDGVVRFAGISSAKHRIAMYRDYGWAEFVFDASTISNTIDLGPAASIAIYCPVAANGSVCSVQTTFDGSTWVEVVEITLATGMNFFVGDDAVKVMHCQRTRLVLDGSVTATLYVSVIG